MHITCGHTATSHGKTFRWRKEINHHCHVLQILLPPSLMVKVMLWSSHHDLHPPVRLARKLLPQLFWMLHLQIAARRANHESFPSTMMSHCMTSGNSQTYEKNQICVFQLCVFTALSTRVFHQIHAFNIRFMSTASFFTLSLSLSLCM